MPPPLSGNLTTIPVAPYANANGGAVAGDADATELVPVTPEIFATAIDIALQALDEQVRHAQEADRAVGGQIVSNALTAKELCTRLQSAIQPLLRGERSNGTFDDAISIDFAKFREMELNLIPENISQLMVDLAKQGIINRLKLDPGVLPLWLDQRYFYVEYEKSRPYYSAKQDGRQSPDLNLNGKAGFADAEVGSTEKVWCRHLALTMLDQWSGPKVKEPYAQYATLDAIAQNHPRSLETRFWQFLEHDSDVYLVNHQIGKCFQAEFASMELRGVAQQSMYMVTANHAMTWQLKIKDRDNGSKDYVVKFYEPNKTATHQRVALKSLDEVAKLEVGNFVSDIGHSSQIDLFSFSFRSVAALMHKRSYQNQHVAPRRLIDYVGQPVLTAKALFLLMYCNVAGSIAAFANNQGWLAQLPEKGKAEALKELLAAKHPDGTPGLYVAMQRGHADAIKAFGDLLQHLPEEGKAAVLKELLAAKNPKGWPGLYIALHEGHADAIKAFGVLLTHLPIEGKAEAIKELLAANSSVGAPGLYAALQNGQADAIKAFGELLLLLPNEGKREALKELLLAKSPEGWPGLSAVLLLGKTEAIKAYGDLLRTFSDVLTQDDLFELLAARTRSRGYAAYVAHEAGQSVAMKAYKEVVRDSNLSDSQKADLLAKRFKNSALRLPGEYLKQVMR